MRENIKKAMAEIRKHKIIAKMNHLCCASCAGYDLAEQLDNMPKDKAKDKIGFAFWHRQDEEHYRNTGKLYIRYSGIDTAKYPNRDKKTGWTTEKVGNIIVGIFTKHGVPVKWNGDPTKCIIVGDSEKILENV